MYPVGVVASLVLVGHVSDWYSRRVVLLPAIAIVAAVLFLVWRSLAALVVARVLTGVAVGAAVATATAFITDLDAAPGGGPTRRAGIVATIANIGGIALGPLIAGLLARYEPHGLTLPFQVFLAGLALAMLAVALAPEGHPPVQPRPMYRPQHLSIPAHARRQFTSAIAGVFLSFGGRALEILLVADDLDGPLASTSTATSSATSVGAWWTRCPSPEFRAGPARGRKRKARWPARGASGSRACRTPCADATPPCAD